MGRYLNPGNAMFQMSLNSRIYVDKSGIIARLNETLLTEDRFVCVSRPRRFGKTMTGNMLAAYYGQGCDSSGQFDKLAIAADESYRVHLNRYAVIQLNIRDFLTANETMAEMLEDIETRVIREVTQSQADVCYTDASRLSEVLADVHAVTNIPFVFIIDEWDSVFRVHEHDLEAQKNYLDWLRVLLKDKPYVALAYMTGILPIKKYGEHSALNMFTEISMIDPYPYEEFTGFTEREVADICTTYGLDADEMRSWYDGYDVNGTAIYNPRSVVQAATRGAYSNYWTQTEDYSALSRYIKLDMDGLRDRVTRLIAGESLPVDTTAFQNDMTTFASAADVLTLLVHLGYLTYERASGTVRIPNREVAEQFRTTARVEGWNEVARALDASETLVRATLAGDAEEVAALIERSHDENTSILKYNDENSMACALSLAYFTMRRTHLLHREMPAGKGFADLVFIPRRSVDMPAVVVELKWDKAVETALDQVRQRQYTDALRGYAGDVLLVGVSYDKDIEKRGKKHHCLIERVMV